MRSMPFCNGRRRKENGSAKRSRPIRILQVRFAQVSKHALRLKGLETMLRLVTDENFSRRILNGLLGNESIMDVVRVQDVGLLGADDPSILEWAAQEGRIVLTHDKRMMISFAYQRILANKPMPGLFVVQRSGDVGEVINDLLVLAGASFTDEFDGQVWHIPL